MAERYALVYAREAYSALLTAALDSPHVVVTTRAEFVAAIAKRRPTIAYVDLDLLPQLDGGSTNVPIVGIAAGALDVFVQSLRGYPWLSHLISADLLSAPTARPVLARLRERLENGPEYDVLGPAGIGRVALLASSARREARLERLREFFATRDVPNRTVAAVSDIAEELMTNALYDAPTDAGYFTAPVSRTADVELPPEHACEISYGIDTNRVFVRSRDPFGAFTRSRLLAVLDRCNHKGVSLDESRGGAGLGLWRVFSTASTIAITVIPGRLTDILVWVDSAKRRPAAGKLNAVQLFFPREYALDGASGRFAADHDHDLMDDSFTALLT